MAWRQTGAEPLPEPMLAYWQLDPYEQTSLKFESKYKTFYLWSLKWRLFYIGEGELNCSGCDVSNVDINYWAKLLTLTSLPYIYIYICDENYILNCIWQALKFARTSEWPSLIPIDSKTMTSHASWRLISPATRSFVQQFVQEINKWRKKLRILYFWEGS